MHRPRNATWPADASAAPYPEVAGPREENLVEIAKFVADRRGEQVRIECVNNPDDPDHLEEADALLPAPHATLAGPTFAEWLDTTTGDPASPLV